MRPRRQPRATGVALAVKITEFRSFTCLVSTSAAELLTTSPTYATSASPTSTATTSTTLYLFLSLYLTTLEKQESSAHSV
ncbi:hypothetical protein ACFX2B_012453 [Malus domestica]